MRTEEKSLQPFIGDQVFAGFVGFQGCGSVLLLGMLSAVRSRQSLDVVAFDFSVTITPGVSISGLEKLPDYPASVFALAAIMITPVLVWLTLAIWRGRKWSLWLMFLIHFPGALFAGFSRDYVPSAIALAVTIYTFLRISGKAGPKL